MPEPDVVIVGAGAAGIGAGIELAGRGIPFVILEAADRAGGRAFTDTASLPHLWDRGCHWLHCADVNPLVAWADRLGADYLRQTRFDHLMVSAGGVWADEATRGAARAALHAAFGAIYEAAARGEDVAVADVLPDAGRWAPAVRHILQLMASGDPEDVSAAAYGDYDDTEVNWPVISGYGDLIGRMAAGLPIRLGVPVTRVEEAPGGVRVETGSGTLAAKAAIVTVSTNVLRAGAIGLGRGPARDLLDLVEDVPCGSYEKVAVALRRRVVEETGKQFCMVDPDDGTAPVDFQISASGAPLMIAHLGGSLARGLADAGAAAMTDFALERLALAFGTDIRAEVVATATTGWQHDPSVLGAYSHARPGAASRRHAMIAADTGRIAFAGEAFSRPWQATAHGAYASGRDVAARVAAHVAGAISTGVVRTG